MQPQPPAPSDAQPAVDAQASAEGSEQQPQEASRPGWVQRLFGRRGAEGDKPQDPELPAQTSATLSLTQEELDRKVQAEADRRDAKRAAQALAERRRKLRDEDPWAYAAEERQQEQATTANDQVGTLFASIGAEHDKHTLDPLVQALPEAERTRILAIEGAGSGLQGRKLIVSESLKALEKHWKEEGAKDAEQRLRRNSAFRKQVLADARRGMAEPELLPAGAASDSAGSDGSVSMLLRQQLQARQLR